MNSPAGMSTTFIPMELVHSTGSPRCLAHASWCFLACSAPNGATASGGAGPVRLTFRRRGRRILRCSLFLCSWVLRCRRVGSCSPGECSDIKRLHHHQRHKPQYWGLHRMSPLAARIQVLHGRPSCGRRRATAGRSPLPVGLPTIFISGSGRITPRPTGHIPSLRDCVTFDVEEVQLSL